jgi:hypothetical protein
VQGDALANGNRRKSVLGTEKCQALKLHTPAQTPHAIGGSVVLGRGAGSQQKGNLSG